MAKRKQNRHSGITKDKNGQYRYTYRDEYGKVRTKYFSGTPAGFKEALKFKSEIQYNKEHGISVTPEFLNPDDYDAKVTVSDIMQDWVDHKKLMGNKLRWVEEWISVYNERVAPIIGHIDPNNLTYKKLTRMAAELWSKNSGATRNRYMGYLKSAFNLAITNNHLDENPLKEWKKVKEKKRRPGLKLEDLKKLKIYAKPHVAWAIEVMWNVPVRPGVDLFGLTFKENVDYDRQGIHAYHNKVDQSVFIQCSQDFLTEVYQYQLVNKTGYLIEYRGKPVKRISKSLKYAADKNGININCMYDIRHLWITTMLDLHVDLGTIAYMAGTSPEMIHRNYYEHLNTQATAVNSLPSLSDKKKTRVINLHKPK